MDFTASNLQGLFSGFKVAFNKGLKEAQSHFATISMQVPSASSSTTYAWLADLPGIREWIGERIVHELSGEHYIIKNRLFEETVSVSRTQIEDDQYGVFKPIFEKMGRDTARHPDTLVFDLLGKGFSTLCFDGQYFFDAEHAVGENAVVSNVQSGDGPAWFLLDCSQAIKPIIWQERLPFEFTQIASQVEHEVFFKDRYTYGVRGRCNAGFGLWQLAFASKAPLNAENYETARKTMQEFKGDNGAPLGIMPTHLVAPPALEGAARRLLKNMLVDGGTNEWAGSAEVIVTPFLGGTA